MVRRNSEQAIYRSYPLSADRRNARRHQTLTSSTHRNELSEQSRDREGALPRRPNLRRNRPPPPIRSRFPRRSRIDQQQPVADFARSSHSPITSRFLF